MGIEQRVDDLETRVGALESRVTTLEGSKPHIKQFGFGGVITENDSSFPAFVPTNDPISLTVPTKLWIPTGFFAIRTTSGLPNTYTLTLKANDTPVMVIQATAERADETVSHNLENFISLPISPGVYTFTFTLHQTFGGLTSGGRSDVGCGGVLLLLPE